jgi:YbbR domain-containing protein
MRDLLVKDLPWKVFSLALALVLWLTVHRITEETHDPEVPLAPSTVMFESLPVLIVSTASDVHDFRVLPPTVSVTVSGPTNIMAALAANQVRPMVDMTEIGDVKNLKRRVDVSTPPGVTLISVSPADVDVVLPPGH